MNQETPLSAFERWVRALARVLAFVYKNIVQLVLLIAIPIFLHYVNEGITAAYEGNQTAAAALAATVKARELDDRVTRAIVLNTEKLRDAALINTEQACPTTMVKPRTFQLFPTKPYDTLVFAGQSELLGRDQVVGSVLLYLQYADAINSEIEQFRSLDVRADVIPETALWDRKIYALEMIKNWSGARELWRAFDVLVHAGRDDQAPDEEPVASTRQSVDPCEPQDEPAADESGA